MQSLTRPTFNRLALLALLALTFACAGLTALLHAAPADAHVCGFNRDEWYRHCTNDGSHVLITAEDFWGTEYTRCVGPGETFLGDLSYWRITGAWYIGFTC
jgi:hypothetical protein